MDGGWPKAANHQLDRYTSAFLFFWVFVFLTYNHSQLIDFILTTHPAYQELVKLGQEQKKNIYTGMLN